MHVASEQFIHPILIDLQSFHTSGNVDIPERDVGHRIRATIMRRNELYVLPGNGESYQFCFERPDGRKSSVYAALVDGCLEAPIPLEITEISGCHKCEFFMQTDDGKWITTPQFTVHVHKVIYDRETQEEIVAKNTALEEILASENQRIENENRRIAAEEDREQRFAEMTASVGIGSYETLQNKPMINGHTLSGDKTSEDLQLIGEISNEKILLIWNTIMNDN